MKNLLFNSHDIVLLVVCYLCFLFAGMTLLKRRESDLTHLWLGFFLLSQVGLSAYILALYGTAFHHWSVVHVPWIFATLELSFWLEGPLLLLYTRSALYQNISFNRRDLGLLLPIFIYVFTLIITKNYFETAQGTNFLAFLQSSYSQYYEHLRNIIRAGFGFWALFTILHYQSKISSAYSELDAVKYTWLKLLVIGFIILRLWSEFNLLLFTLITHTFNFSLNDFITLNLIGIIANYGQLLLISSLIIFALLDSRNILRLNKDTLESITKIEQRNTYTSEQVLRVSNHMKKKRPYLNNQLKIDQLALQVSLSPKSLSNLINREFQVNFFEYINCYRITEVSAYFNDPKMSDQSIIELAFLAGYNSKSSFNRLFKIETGKTPSQFRHDAMKTSG